MQALTHQLQTPPPNSQSMVPIQQPRCPCSPRRNEQVCVGVGVGVRVCVHQGDTMCVSPIGVGPV